MKTSNIVLIAGILLNGCALADSPSVGSVPKWAVGYWVQTQDEDGAPRDDTVQIRADGSVVVYDQNCTALPAGDMHQYRGNLYATFVVRKGQISMMYKPAPDHKSLTFTSPRTGNNAVYEPTSGCVPAGAN